MKEVIIDGWSNNIEFSSTHILPGHYKCGRMHGHNSAISVKIEGKATMEGIVIDFMEIEDKLKEIRDRLDHKVFLSKDTIQIDKENNEVELKFDGKNIFSLTVM